MTAIEAYIANRAALPVRNSWVSSARFSKFALKMGEKVQVLSDNRLTFDSIIFNDNIENMVVYNSNHTSDWLLCQPKLNTVFSVVISFILTILITNKTFL